MIRIASHEETRSGQISREIPGGYNFSLGLGSQSSWPAEFSAFLHKEADRWGKLLRERNARLDD